MQPRNAVKIELVESTGGVAPVVSAPAPRGGSLLLIGLGVLSVIGLLLALGRTTTGPPASESVNPPAVTAPTAPAAATAADTVGDVAGFDASRAGSVDDRWHRVWAAPAAEDAPATVLFTATPSSRRSAPPFMHIVGDEVTMTRTLDGPVWLEEPSIEWPGEVLSPFVQTRSSIVYPSDGMIWSQDLAFDRPHKPLVAGVRVLAGSSAEQVWVVGSGGRTLQLVDLAQGSVAAFSAPSGHALAAYGGGLVLRVLDAGERSYVVWRTDGTTESLDVESTMEFLGVGGDRAVFTDGTTVAVHDRLDGTVRTVPLESPLDVRRAAVSPDGHLVALATRPDIVSFSDVHVVRVKTGELVDRFGPVMDLQLQFVDPDTMQFTAPGSDLPWEVTHRDVVGRTERVVAGAESPMLWFAELGDD